MKTGIFHYKNFHSERPASNIHITKLEQIKNSERIVQYAHKKHIISKSSCVFFPKTSNSHTHNHQYQKKKTSNFQIKKRKKKKNFNEHIPLTKIYS